MAKKTVSRMLDKVSQLYEQNADEVTETYLKRWWRWVRSGVDGILCVDACFEIGLVGALGCRASHSY
ncbi:MAG: hypothetical protein F6K47_42345 [Symploca sp. SIO2E6]|nr:hypothetical protein [Symploca sp. SIO2E6]